MKHKELLNESIKELVTLCATTDAINSTYLGIIAVCMADIADKICGTEDKDDHYELMKLKSEILEYIDYKEISLMDREIDKDEVMKVIESIKHEVDAEFYDYIHMVPEEDEEE